MVPRTLYSEHNSDLREAFAEKHYLLLCFSAATQSPTCTNQHCLNSVSAPVCIPGRGVLLWVQSPESRAAFICGCFGCFAVSWVGGGRVSCVPVWFGWSGVGWWSLAVVLVDDGIVVPLARPIGRRGLCAHATLAGGVRPSNVDLIVSGERWSVREAAGQA